uniref:Uncharacterized protein n=1 Tax=uncultured archaeon MedDCM-OCT-S04-C140 TaxID=743085 RepID=D6PB57_9ARCH|nr:hypothetical protein [uncultured archaeon MedDCM-OCT-S04-C140]
MQGLRVVVEWENEGCKKAGQQGHAEIPIQIVIHQQIGSTGIPKQTGSTCDAPKNRNGKRETNLQKKASVKFPSQVKKANNESNNGRHDPHEESLFIDHVRDNKNSHAEVKRRKVIQEHHEEVGRSAGFDR